MVEFRNQVVTFSGLKILGHTISVLSFASLPVEVQDHPNRQVRSSLIIAVHCSVPFNRERVGDKDSAAPADFVFSVVCMIDAHDLDTALTQGFPNHPFETSGIVSRPAECLQDI